MRTFVAVDLPKEVKDYIFNLEKKLKQELPAKISWKAKKNLHITLKFLGEVENLEEIKSSLKKIKFKPFKLCLSELGTFSEKVFWMGIEPEEPFLSLAKKIDEETMRYNPNVEFKTHLTLGKIKILKDKEKFRKIMKSIKIENLEFEVNSFQLIQSSLTKDGARYKILEEYSL
jgi:2'-5' RNA ligase